GEGRPDGIVEPREGNSALRVHPPGYPSRPGGRTLARRHDRLERLVDDDKFASGSERKPFRRWASAARLMRPVGVVMLDPRVDRALQLLHAGMAAVVLGEELRAQRLVESLDLPRRGRRIRRGEQMLDAVVVAYLVEQHRPR